MFKKLFLFFFAFSLWAFSDKAPAYPPSYASMIDCNKGGRVWNKTQNKCCSAGETVNENGQCINPAAQGKSSVETNIQWCDENIINLEQWRKIRSNLQENQKQISNNAGIDDEAKTKKLNLLEEPLKGCQTLITKHENEQNIKKETCETDIRNMREAKSEFASACGEFSTGRVKCDEAIEACSKCPDESESAGYDCVKTRAQSKCPALAGEALREAKEQIEELENETEDIERDIKDGETDLADTENDLRQSLTELEEDFSQTARDLEREAEEQKADLEDQLRQSQSEIQSALSESLAKAQAQLNESLKIAHSFENAIFKANMEYRAERRKIVMECEVQAQGRLAQYRRRRRSAIQTGSLTASLSSLLRRGRSSFAARDKRLLKQYKAQCLSNRKADFKEAKKLYQHKLRVIEQQKEQYQEKLSQIKRQFAGLSQQAGQQENSLIQSYAASMQKIIDNHMKEHKLAMQTYQKAKKSLLAQTNKLFVAQRQLSEKKQDQRLKQTELLREREMRSYLQSRGARDEGSAESLYGRALSSLNAYADSISVAKDSCFCSQPPDEFFEGKCGEIDRQGERLEEQGAVGDLRSLGLEGAR